MVVNFIKFSFITSANVSKYAEFKKYVSSEMCYLKYFWYTIENISK